MNKFLEKISLRRFLVMAAGIVLLSLGITLFKFSLMGNDPGTAMVIAISDTVGLSFANTLLLANTSWFIVEFIFGRRYIGIATFFSWFGIGYIATGFSNAISAIFIMPTEFMPRLLVMFLGVIIVSLACSMYQTADLGISPYDALSITLTEKLPKIHYFWCRIFTDAVCAFIAFRLGGLIGIGTLVSAFGLGPFISFFDRHVSRRLCGMS